QGGLVGGRAFRVLIGNGSARFQVGPLCQRRHRAENCQFVEVSSVHEMLLIIMSSLVRGRAYGSEFDVIEGGVFGAIGAALDAQGVACLQSDRVNAVARGGVCVGNVGGEMIVGGPFGDEAVGQIDAELRDAVGLVEVTDVHVVAA